MRVHDVSKGTVSVCVQHKDFVNGSLHERGMEVVRLRTKKSRRNEKECSLIKKRTVGFTKAVQLGGSWVHRALMLEPFPEEIPETLPDSRLHDSDYSRVQCIFCLGFILDSSYFGCGLRQNATRKHFLKYMLTKNK